MPMALANNSSVTLRRERKRASKGGSHMRTRGDPSRPAQARAPQRLCCLSSVLPWFLVPEHSIEDGEKLAGDCDEGNHLGLTEGEQVLIEGPQHVVATDCGHCRHEDGRANGCATAGDHAFALPLAGLLGARCDSDQAGDLVAAALA